MKTVTLLILFSIFLVGCKDNDKIQKNSNYAALCEKSSLFNSREQSILNAEQTKALVRNAKCSEDS